jgi:DNA polymerase-4
MTTKIIHIDMDAFFASVEQRDFPELQGKPVAVGGGAERGVVAAASYEARKFGVRSAMNGRHAKELCPRLIFVPPRFDVYKQASREIHEVFERYTDLIEPLSLDEAYLDVTCNKIQLDSGTFIAQSIKNEIFQKTGLVASAGVSYNKFLAKLASDQDKPDGLYIIEPFQGKAFVANLPIGKFHGVGKATADKMKELGIFRGKDILLFEEKDLVRHFGKAGHFFYNIARGIDNREVRAERERKSVGVENTFSQNILGDEDVWEECKKLLEKLWKRVGKNEKYGRTLSLKIRNNHFETQTKSKTIDHDIIDMDMLYEVAADLYNAYVPFDEPLRLIGFSMSNFNKEDEEDFQLRMEW